MNRYNTQVDQPVIQQRVEPQRYSDKQFLYTWTAGALLPLGQAFITGLIAAIAVAAIIYLADGYNYLKPMIATGGAAFVLTWAVLQRRWLIVTAERLTHIDINNDGKIGQQKPAPKPVVRVQIDEITSQGHLRQSQMFDLPATPAQLKALAIGILDEGRTFAEKEWSPLEADRPFSIQGIRDLKAEMIKRGLLVAANSKSKQLGFVATAVGKRTLERWKALEIDEE